MRPISRLAAVAAGLVIAIVLPAPAHAELAKPADSLVHSIGVNTHLTFAGTTYANFSLTRQRLQQLGVKQIRDAMCGTCTERLAQYRTLGQDAIALDAEMGRPTDSAATFQSNLAGVKSLGSIVDAVEGANEWDLFAPDRSQWAAQDRAFQIKLFKAMKSDPALASTPVIGPSLVFWWTNPSSWTTLGDLSPYLSYGNSHGYPGGKTPESMVGQELGHAQTVSGAKPIYMTESGYHNALQQANNDHPPTPEDIAAVYVPRLFLDNFRRGIARTDLYELFDERAGLAATDQEQSFGLARADGTPKPAFNSLRNLIAVLADPGTRIASADVPVTVSTATSDVRFITLRKRDGRVYVAAWRTISLWNPLTRTRIAEPPPASVKVTFGGTVNGIRAYRPVSSAAGTELARSGGTVTIPVGAAPVILEKR